MGYMGEGNGGLGVEGKWEGEAMVVARDETQKVLRIRPIHDHNL
jgi:hypothetical protein